MLGRLLRLFVVVILLGVLLKYVLGKQQKRKFGYWVHCLALILLLITSLIWLLYALQSDFW
ncbi:protein MIGRI [Snodgrassella alvi]|jgi:hypothetical protein|uniref:Uncharacterized protein n=1 Tax=Snodgrassella alvi TaxID=1196083 RepID=A0A2N9XWF5_9NEIS|nr:hypothetical protein [Snodgrassella alvi]PIT54038.1 hypothetical protein BHC49_08790 [Snodgrassella alvi]